MKRRCVIMIAPGPLSSGRRTNCHQIQSPDARVEERAMVGRCICILMVLSLARGNDALADGARGSGQAVPEIEALEPELEGLYKDLHEHPELAFHEERTASTLAERLRALGF